MDKKIFCIITVIILISTLALNTFASPIIIESGSGIERSKTFRPTVEHAWEISVNSSTYYVGDTYTFPLIQGYGSQSAYNGEGTQQIEQLHVADFTMNLSTQFIINSTQTALNGCTIQKMSVSTNREYIMNNGQPVTNDEVDKMYIIARDFYIWNEDTFYNSLDNIYSEFNIDNTATANIDTITITYRETNKTETHTIDVPKTTTKTWYPKISDFTNYEGESDLLYIEQAVITLKPSHSSYYNYITPSYILCENTSIEQAVINSYGDIGGNPAINLREVGLSMATAVGGFLSFEIMPNFTLGGILMVTLAFLCVMWWLKLVAGG